MSKADAISSADAELLAMISRHGELNRKMDAIYRHGDAGTRSREYKIADREQMDIEERILVWPAETPGGEEARLRFLRERPDRIKCLDAKILLATIAKLNAERVRAGKVKQVQAAAAAVG
jgi:hypothetical protein